MVAIKEEKKVFKSSFSIRKNNWDRLRLEKNRSLVINKALEMFYSFKDHVDNSKNEFYNSMLDEALAEVDRGKTQKVPMKDGKIDRDNFMKEIWS